MPCLMLVALCLGAASPGSAEPTRAGSISLSYEDAEWPAVLEALARMLDDAEVSGEPPDCRVTIHMRDVLYDEALEQLNQRFGLAFVRVSDRYTIFLPADTTRMCPDG